MLSLSCGSKKNNESKSLESTSNTQQKCEFEFIHDSIFTIKNNNININRIFFEQDFKNDTITVLNQNKKVILESVISTDYSTGLAYELIFDSIPDFNKSDSLIYLKLNKTFCELELNIKGDYQIIYCTMDLRKKDAKKVKINYSNTLKEYY